MTADSDVYLEQINFTATKQNSLSKYPKKWNPRRDID